MSEQIVLSRNQVSEVLSPGTSLPSIVVRAGRSASDRFLEFFTAQIRNPNTREAYGRAVARFFEFIEKNFGHELWGIKPFHVAAYVEDLGREMSPPSVKQHLAAVRMLFDYLVTGAVIPMNPASSVRGPKHVVKKGKTPVLTSEQARKLLDSIETNTIVGLRDRALIATMVYSFARVGAVVGMRVEDYFENGRRSMFRLHEKGGKYHEVPAHHNAETYVDAYLVAAAVPVNMSAAAVRRLPLFRSVDRRRQLTTRKMSRTDVLQMIKRRARSAGLPFSTCCHTFRATGITSYLENGGTIEKAQMIANHESPRTTKLYDRTQDQVTLDEIERIGI
jgi:site-specific recombinase XerD